MININRGDGGKFQAPKYDKVEQGDPFLLIPIAYDKDVAELAATKRVKYREAYIEFIRQANGQDKTGV